MKRRSTSALPGFAAAAALHAGLLGFLFLSDPPEPRAAVRQSPVRVRVIERRPPPSVQPEVKPEARPEPAAETTKKKLERSKPIEKPVLVEALPEPVPVTPKPEARAEPAPQPAAQPEPAALEASAAAPAQTRTPRRFTVALSATVASGGVAVPTAAAGGGWAFGAPDGDPGGERSLAGPAPAPAADAASGGVLPTVATAVTALPRLVAQPSFREMRELYPETARADGLEADVALKILVSTRGEVVKVRVLRRAGQGFDEAAETLVKRFRFAPGLRGDEPVAVWIPWTYRFRLEG